MPRIFPLPTGKYSSSRKCSHTSGDQGPPPKRTATSTSSARKFASAVVAITLTSMPGFASMKRIRRGMSQREAKDGSTLTVSRSSRRTRSGFGGLGNLLERRAHLFGEHPSRRRERDPLAVAREERRAHVLFEGAHLVAHGAVGEVQLLGGARKALQARGRLERAQRGQGWKAAGHV